MPAYKKRKRLKEESDIDAQPSEKGASPDVDGSVREYLELEEDPAMSLFDPRPGDRRRR